MIHRKFAILSMLLAVGYCVPAHAQPGPFTPLIFTAANPDGTACSSSSPLRYYTATNTVYGCSSGAYAAISGSGTGTVTSAVIAGTASQITASGTCTITTTGTCTLSLPSGLLIPGTINKLTLTPPATGATFTLADGKTFTVSNTLTFTGTDASSVAFGAGGTVLYTGALPNGTTATTQSAGSNDTKLATDAYVDTAVGTVRAALSTAVTDGSPITWALGSAYVKNGTVTLAHGTATRALNITNPIDGGFYTLIVKQDSTGGAALTPGTGCTWKVGGGGAGVFTLTATASAIDVITFAYDGTNCYANIQNNFN